MKFLSIKPVKLDINNPKIQAILKNTYTAKKQLKFDLNNKIEEFLNK